MLTFKRKYFYWTVILFFIEVCIAIFINDQFIRPFIGDVLVVILIYCFIKAFLQINSFITALGVFLFACFVEILQYLDIVRIFGWEKYKIVVVILGSTFDWKDIIAYAIGTVGILWLEKSMNLKKI